MAETGEVQECSIVAAFDMSFCGYYAVVHFNNDFCFFACFRTIGGGYFAMVALGTGNHLIHLQ